MLAPRLGLSTRTTTFDDAAGTPTQVTHSVYTDNGVDATYGLVTRQIEDPAGLGLTTSYTYEPTYRRRATRTLPGGATTTYAYYGNTETSPAISCADGSAIAGGVNQGGLARSSTSPTPAAGSAITYETVYDVIGRPVATRTGTDPWTCSSYDARGRVTKVAHPANGSYPARTVTTAYSAATPQQVSTTDPAGTITSVSDFLGRTTSYTDVWGKATTTVYDAAGRVSRQYGQYVGSGPTSAGLEYTYERGGFVSQVRLDGQPVATPTYTPGVLGGELASVSYPSGAGNAGNGTALSSISRDQYGRTTSLAWTQAGGGSLFTDTVTRSQSGRVVTNTLDGQASSYGYDAAGRLRGATMPGHTYRYLYDGQAGCGAASGAGKNTNRTGVVDLAAAGTSTLTGYCYDNADRLTGVGAPAGYSARMSTLSPSAWWTLTTTSGTTAADNSGNGNVGTYSGSYTLGAAGAPVGWTSANSSVTFSGGNVQVPVSAVKGSTRTYSMWFKTTTAGGVLLSKQSHAVGTTPTGWNPMLYVGTDGKLYARDWPSNGSSVVTTSVVTDGSWHHAVFAVSAAAQTQTLYVDGNAVGQLTSAPVDDSWANYASIGNGYTATWSAGNGGWMPFSGQIDEVAVFPTALSAAQVATLTSPAPSTAATPTYDGHGNTIGYNGQTLGYDVANRHLATQAGSSSVGYVRDSTDRIVGRTATSGGTTTGVRHGYSGAGDVGTATLDTSGAVLERVISLPGGVIVTKRTGGDVWSYPNIHGDVTATANGSGVKQGSNLTYDPYGTPLGGTPDNLNGSMDYAWLGQHQRPYETAPGVTPAIEMGARLYAPELGRFLEVDPIEGGSANDYDYCEGDPSGCTDLNGDTAIPDDIYLSPSNPSFSFYGDNGRFSIQFDYVGRSIQWGYQLYGTTYANAVGPASARGIALINGKPTRYHYSKTGVSPGYSFHSSIGTYQNFGDAPWTSHRLRRGNIIFLNIEITYKTSSGIRQVWWVRTRVHL